MYATVYHTVSILSYTQPTTTAATTTNTDILNAGHHQKNILVIDMAGVENYAAEFILQKQVVDLLIMMCLVRAVIFFV